MDRKNVYEIDESDWQLYIKDCEVSGLRPSISDYLVWCDDNDLERPEVWDGTDND